MSAWNLGDITVEVRGGGRVRGPEKSGGLVELCASWVRAAFKPWERRESRVSREGRAEIRPGGTLALGRSKSQQKGLRGVTTGAGGKSRPCDALELRGDHPGAVEAAGSDAAGVKDAKDGARWRPGGVQPFAGGAEAGEQREETEGLQGNSCGDNSWCRWGRQRGVARGNSGAF